MAHGEVETVVAINLERFKPGEIPERYVRGLRAEMQAFKKRLEERDGIKTLDKLSDVVVAITGDIIVRQKWVDGKDATTFAGCVNFAGAAVPWATEILLSSKEESNTEGLTDAVKSGEAGVGYPWE